MNRPSLLGGIAFAFAATVLTAPIWWTLQTLSAFPWAFKLGAVLPYLGYCLYLLLNAGLRFGFLSLAAVNILAALALLGLPGSPFFTASSLAVLVTVNRSLLFHRNLMSIAFDGAVSSSGFLFATYLFTATGSMPAAIWSYFLLQAAFVLIPACIAEQTGNSAMENLDDPFLQSQRQAEEALRQLARTTPG